MPRLLRGPGIVLALVLLWGCAMAPRARHDAVPRQSTLAPISPVPETTLSPPRAFVTPAGWELVYLRPGFDGDASLDLRAVGDIMLGRHVEHSVRARPAEWLLDRVAPLLTGDVTVGNLESPFASNRRPEYRRPGPYRLVADPSLVTRLAPFNALSLANNHALDAETRGLNESVALLAAHGIEPVGVNQQCDVQPTSESAGVQLLAYNAVSDPHDRPDEATRCGRRWLDDAAIAEVVDRHGASERPLVVLVHWGREYAMEPTPEQRDWAERLVAAGADLILGTHPHVLQPVAVVKAGGRQGVVAYSLGNFVFDQRDRPETNGGVVLRAWLDARGVGAVAAAPIAMEHGRPVPLDLQQELSKTYLAALSPALPAGDGDDREPVATTHAWHWNGATFEPWSVGETFSMAGQPQAIEVDLRGDGLPLTARLQDGIVEVIDRDEVVWRNEDPAWNVTGMTSGDVDNDGRYELLLWLWKPDPQGVNRSHPFLVGWRGGRYRVFWGGSAVAAPIQQAAIGPVTGERNLLIVLEGGTSPREPAERVAVWLWKDWYFERFWESEPGVYQTLHLHDLDGDGVPEIIASRD
jgi:poly-gamma-glutamate capsule biosynthesis protein CapA/YwtB (metallophosphatase superfamily)